MSTKNNKVCSSSGLVLPLSTVNGNLVCANLPGNQVVAACYGVNGPNNAADIVQACNAYPELLAACEEMVRAAGDTIGAKSCFLAQFDAMRAAIAKAKGESENTNVI